MLRALLLFAFCIGTVSFAEAHVPNLVEIPGQSDVYLIEDPILSQAFYGVLDDFPHTYKIQKSEPFTLSLQILQPDISSSNNNVSAIVVKLPKERGRVEEIIRLEAKDATWETFYEPFGGDMYRRGSSFTQDLEAGSYIVEVHTPDNREKYVLVVGSKEEMSIGYFETLKRLVAVKKFFDKSPVRIVESPYAYIPLLAILAVSIGIRRRMKRAYAPKSQN